MAIRRTNSENAFTGVLEFIKTNWLLLLAALVALPFVYRYVNNILAQIKASNLSKDVAVNNSQNGVSSPVIIQQKIVTIKKKYPNLSVASMEKCKTVAQKIALALGTNVEDNHNIMGADLYNIAAWSEDESEVVKLLKTVPGTFPVVEDLYYNLFTRSRNLKTDLVKYLSQSDLKNIRAVYKKYNVNWI